MSICEFGIRCGRMCGLLVLFSDGVDIDKNNFNGDVASRVVNHSILFDCCSCFLNLLRFQFAA